MSHYTVLNNIFRSSCSYDTINRLSDVQLRHIENGLSIQEAIWYKFKYTDITTTKDSIVYYINNYNREKKNNNQNFTRRTFESKEKNIGTKVYSLILNQLMNYYNSHCNSRKKGEYMFMAIDGTSNNNHKCDIIC